MTRRAPCLDVASDPQRCLRRVPGGARVRLCARPQGACRRAGSGSPRGHGRPSKRLSQPSESGVDIIPVGILSCARERPRSARHELPCPGSSSEGPSLPSPAVALRK